MEAAGAASALVGLIAFSGDVLCAGYGYIHKVSKAPAEMRMLLSEVASLNMLFSRLQVLAEDSKDSLFDSALKSLDELGVFRDCVKLIKSVQESVDKCREVNGEEMRNLGRRLLWPFKEKETKDTIKQLERLRDTISTALAVDSAAAVNDLRKASERVAVKIDNLMELSISQAERDAQERLLNWLSPEVVDPAQNYEAALLSRQPFTGRWFLKSSIFISWLDSNSSLLWIHGIPGCGKTVLSATIIEHIQSEILSPDTALAYFYFDHRDSQKQALKGFIATAIKQLVRQNVSCLAEVAAQFDSGKYKSSNGLPDAQYVPLLRSMCQQFKRTILVVDALDECLEEELEPLIHSLRELLNPSNSCTIQILATSRHELSIERLISPLVMFQISLMKGIRQDIVTYVNTEVGERIRSKRLKLRNPELAEEIKNALLRNADGMFLRAKIQIAHLSTLGSDRAIKQALNVLPQGLEETYDGVLRRIMLSNPDRIEELKCIFRWLIGAEYILDLRELAEAVSIGPEDKELDLDGIATDPEDLAAFGSSLVTVDRRHDPPLISFAHYSIEEYLRSPRILKSPMAEFHMDRFSVNRALAISCLQYLSFANFATPLSPRFDYQDNFAEALSSRLKQHSLLFYAANNWYKHLRASGTASESFDAEVQVHMQWFLHPNVNGNQYTSWQEVVDPRFSSFRHRRAFILDLSFHPPLYVALACGLDNVANLILSQMSEQEIAVMLSDGLTPLHAAAMQGHPDMLETLLKAGIPIDAPSKGKNARKLTALHIAAEASNVAAVRFLLMAGASPHARSAAGTTPFYKAVRAGCETVIDDLYNAGSDCDVRTWNYWTPMIEAISENNVSVVEKLLSWGVDPLARHNPAIMSPMELAQFLKRGAIVEVMEAAIKKEKHVSVEEKGPNAVRKPHSHLSGTKSVESGMGVNFRQRGSAQDAPPILVVETYIPSPLETYMPSPVPFGDPKNSLADWSPRSLSAHQSLPTRSYSPGRLQQQNQDK